MLDGQVARRDPELGDVLDQFVCVRVVEVNDLDLATFQFDTGLTWAVLFMNADKTVYGRYGSRSGLDGLADATLQGFRKAALAALEIHKAYPGNKASLAGKAGAPPRFPTPRGYPSLKEYPKTIDPAAGERGRDNPTCIHCHQIQAAEYRMIRGSKEPIPDRLLWAYPMPSALGLELDAQERARIRSVAAGSPAAKAGFRQGDDLLSLEGQPLISVADIQWILDRAPEDSPLRAVVRRDGAPLALDLAIPPGFRRKGDFSWRAATSDTFRPDMTGESLSLEEREKRNMGDADIAIRITYSGIRLPGADVRKDDILVEVDGRRTGLPSFSEFLAYVAQKKASGETLALTLVRDGKELRRQVTVR